MKPSPIRYQSITIPTSGTFVLVPESEYVRNLDVLGAETFLCMPRSDDLTIGFLLKHHREAKNLSQEQLQELSGVGQKHISSIEKGMIIPRFQTIEKLFPYLDSKFEAGVKFVLEKSKAEKESA